MKNRINVILNRYNEDIIWVSNFTNPNKSKNETYTFLYNKGKIIDSEHISKFKNLKIFKLLNFGREASTYIHHIIEEYDNIKERFNNGYDDLNVFSQIIPDNFSQEEFVDFVNNIDVNKIKTGDIIPLSKLNLQCYILGQPHHKCDLPMFSFINEIIPNINLETASLFNFYANSQFAVKNSTILQNSIEYYERIYNLLVTNYSSTTLRTEFDDINSYYYCAERLWCFIFNQDLYGTSYVNYSSIKE